MLAVVVAVAAAVLALPAGGFAQGGGDGEVGSAGVQGKNTRFERRPDGMYEVIENPNGSRSERMMEPEEVARRRDTGEIANLDGGHLCRGVASPNPRRLAPGEHGELKVLVTLAGHAVALPGSPIHLTIHPIEGFTFGAPVLEPASAGTLAGKFQGRPVHDDYMLFRVPMAVGDKVPSPHQQAVQGTLNIDLHDSRTGKGIGSFTSGVTGTIAIGKSLPNVRAVNAAESKDVEGPGPTGARSHTKPGPGKISDPAGKPAGKSPGKNPSKSAGSTAGGDKAAGNARETGDAGRSDASPGESTAPAPGTVLGAGGQGLLLWGAGVIGVVILILVLARR